MTVEEVELLCQDFSKKKGEIDVVKDTLSRLEEEKRAIESRILAAFDGLNKSRWDINGATLSVREQWSYKTPKTPEAKLKFFSYLREKGIFEEIISVNSQTLNAFAKSEMELARDEGKTEFSIPGLEEPTLYKSIQLRKA